MEPVVDPSETEFDHEELRVFWDLARFHARLNAAPSYFGPTTLEVIVPPAWSFGDTPEEADEFAAAVLAEEMTTTTASLAEYDDVEAQLPVSGSLSILCDGTGRPVALLETSSVDVTSDSVVETFSVVYRAPE